MTLLLAHTFPLPILVMMLIVAVGVGYGLPLAGIHLARKGGRLSAVIITLIPTLWLGIAAFQVLADSAGGSASDVMWIIPLLVGVPLVLCAASWALIVRNYLRRKGE